MIMIMEPNRLLAITAATGRVGMVFFIGRELKDWRISDKAADNAEKAALHIARLIDHLRPDVVVMASSSRSRERLQSLGIRVLALEPKTHADVQRVIAKLGMLMQEPDAQRLWRTIDAGVSAAAQSLPATVRRQRVYFEVNRAPYAAGPGSFMGETLSRLGAQNIIDPKLGPFPKINPELVVRANPDVIMVGDTEGASLSQRPGWSGIAAIRTQSVCLFPRLQSEVLVRPGPRMAEGARMMADCLLKTLPKKL